MMKWRHVKDYRQGSWVWIVSSWALGRDLGPIQNPPVNHGPSWLPLVTIITHSGGPYMGEHLVESTDSPSQSKDKYSPVAMGPCRHSCAWSPSLPTAGCKGCGSCTELIMFPRQRVRKLFCSIVPITSRETKAERRLLAQDHSITI